MPSPPICAEEQLPSVPAASPPRQYQFAKGLWDRGLYEMAANEFAAFIKQNPAAQYADLARYYKIRSFAKSGKYDKALQKIRGLRKELPDYSYPKRLTLLAGELHLKNKNPQAARQEFAKLTAAPDPAVSETAVYYMAEAYTRQDKRRHATALYSRLAAKQLTENHPYRAYAVYALAAIYREVGQLDKAARQYERLINSEFIPEKLRSESLYEAGLLAASQKKYDKAAKLLSEIHSHYPDSTYARPARLREMRARLRNKEAERVLALAKSWKEIHGKENAAQVNYLQGLALQLLNRHKQAAALFKATVAADNTGQYARPASYQTAYSLLRAEEYRATVNVCGDFLQRYPQAAETTDIHYFAGLAAYNLENNRESVNHLKKALQQGQNDKWQYKTATLQLLADAYRKTGASAEAAEVYDRLASSASGSSQARYKVAAAEIHASVGNFEEAIKRYRAAFDTMPAETDQAQNSALRTAGLYLKINQPQEAERFLKDSIGSALTENNPSLQFMLGMAKYRQGEFAAASDILRDLLASGKTNRELQAKIRYILTVSLLELKQTKKALQAFAPILENANEALPDFEEDIILQLAGLYYEADNYKLTKELCRKLVDSKTPRIAHQASLRMAKVYIAENSLAEARALLEQRKANVQEQKDTDTVNKNSEILSLLGEVYMLQGKRDQAIRAFRKSLGANALTDNYLARSQWGIAKILYTEENYREALRHAMNGFILADDAFYTPRAMWLAVKALIMLDRKSEATVTWKEMQERFPATAARHADSKILLQADER
ncbi:MAG: tetratricopeptide repeat protein [Lentisphaeria bacterium]